MPLRAALQRTQDLAHMRGPQHRGDGLVDGTLKLLRAHLGLDVAFVSQLTDSERVFLYVDADGETDIEVGGSDPVEESYCHYVVAGDVPGFVADPRTHEVTRQLAATDQVPVGTHLSVPIVLSDGTVYGTFCGFSRDVIDYLNERDLDLVRLLAAMITGQVEQEEMERRQLASRRALLAGLDAGTDLELVFQPIVAIADRKVTGFETLARFPVLDQGPAEVFADAWMLGIGEELELTAVELALTALDQLPPQCYLTVNVAPATLLDPRSIDVVTATSPGRLVLEITEHAPVTDYPALQAVVADLKARGLVIALDDVGTGFAGLDQILRLEPDILKIDGALVRAIDQQPGKEAMVAALVTFAEKVGATVVAEQVETAAEVRTLADLGVTHAQGYLFGRPAPLPAFEELRPTGSAGGSGPTVNGHTRSIGQTRSS